MNDTSALDISQSTIDPTAGLLDGLASYAWVLGLLSFLSIILTILAIIYVFRLWLVQKATLNMQKDIHDIRDLLVAQVKAAEPPAPPVVEPTAPIKEPVTPPSEVTGSEQL